MPVTKDRPRGTRALEALHFSVADVQDGLGPFLSVFLQSKGWSVAAIGTVMSVGGIAGMLATTPAGALVDATRRKRAVVVVGCLAILLATALIWLQPTSSGVVAAQIASALAAAGIGPALTGITLGLVHAHGFDHQLARNQVANHAGNVLAAVLAIPAAAIDHRAARGLASNNGGDALSGWRVLLTCRPLALLAATLGLFHLGNAAMLPLYGMAIVAAHAGDPSALTATTIVVAQATMVVVALLAMRWIRVHGHWWVLLVAFMALPLRALVAASVIHGWGVFPVQILDGLGAGLQSVVVPALVARLLQGTGRVNVGQGAVMTVQGVGAALSPAFGGWLAHAFGYRIAFLTLGAIALLAVALWAGCRGMLQAAASMQAETVL
ncbi:MFS transporter [Xanthomonas euvesicatoria]|uniref:MFS transporter n=1 Tax=Xanthomonas euvesicatoria TaxID=456327 RepID=UPI001C43727B|nr:MFS transporter [Xanthomonas euvesicatoria]MBV6798200.1 MFS transporter [Xanthomonas campestris pv. obscurae]